MNTTILIILMGLPGSGKSYVANYLYEKYGFEILSGEEMTTQMFGTEKVSSSQYTEVYKFIRQKASELLSLGESVVVDGTNLKREYRQQIYDEIKCERTLLIYLKVDDDIALDRISKRSNSCSEETYLRFKSQTEEPLANENAIVLTSNNKLLDEIDRLLEGN